MYHRGSICAHCADAEAEEPCQQCRQAICISCLLDRAPCRNEAATGGARGPSADALETLQACGIEVAGERLVGADLPLWLIALVRVAPVGEPRPGRPDVLAVSVQTRSGYLVEVMRRSEATGTEDVHAVGRALATLSGAPLDVRGDDAELPPT